MSRWLLTLDLGENLGWTLGPLDSTAPASAVEFGTLKLKATTNLGEYLESAEVLLPDLIQGVNEIAVERTHTGAGSKYFVVRKNVALLGMVHRIAWKNDDIPVKDVSAVQPKLKLAGHGHAKKEQMIAAAHRLGYRVSTEHEADALGVRLVYLFGPAPTAAEKAKIASAARRAQRLAEQAAKPPKAPRTRRKAPEPSLL